jgi:hypothetical protein
MNLSDCPTILRDFQLEERRPKERDIHRVRYGGGGSADEQLGCGAVSGTDLPPVEPARAAVACVIPAKDEAERIVATIDAVRKIAGVDLIVVVDDGSTDNTAEAAERAGALVVRHPRNRGKAAAMETGAAAVANQDAAAAGAGAGPEAAPGSAGAGPAAGAGTDVGARPAAASGVGGRAQARHLLFLDADLADSATGAEPLIEPVLSGRADMTIGTLPAQLRADGSKPGGHGFVVRLARSGIAQATGWSPEQPLSGQRCLTRTAFEAALPLAPGFGVEAALSIDLGRKGFRILEIPIDVRHRASGSDLRGQLHRARQYLHLRRALSARNAIPSRGPSK